jgi:hypothetical protein
MVSVRGVGISMFSRLIRMGKSDELEDKVDIIKEF